MASDDHGAPATVSGLLSQVRQSVENGDREGARQRLDRALSLDPDDYRIWLWLASIAPTPVESEKYVQRAEILAPGNERVSEARLWVSKRLSQQPATVSAVSSTPPAETTKPEPASSQPDLVDGQHAGRLLAGTLVFLLLIGLALGATRLWRQRGPALAQPAVVQSASVVQEVALVSSAEQNAVTDLSDVSGTPAAATPVPGLTAKEVAVATGQKPRPTWTITPTPSPSPIPSPTWVPTFVSPGGKAYQTRPFGVSAEEKWIDVDLSEQSLTAYIGNTAVFDTVISSGTYEHQTVTGQFRIWLAYESQTMDGTLLGYDYYLENVPYVMYFFEDYALHGAPWHNNFGSPMSHGCVDLDPGDAGWIYSWASIGTLVNVHD